MKRPGTRDLLPASRLRTAAPSIDLHLHTDWTDGRSSIEQMLEASMNKDLDVVAFTEHVRRGITWWPDFAAHVRQSAKSYPFTVLVGIEAKVLDFEGHLDADPELLSHADLVLGAFHNYPDGKGGWLGKEQLDAQMAADIEFRATRSLIERAEIDVIAHPGAMTRRFFGSFPEQLLDQLCGVAFRSGVAVEINSEYNSDSELDFLLERCIVHGATISLGSNAHSADEVGRILMRMRRETA